ncbi:LysR family transcriptional regulator [Gammaproteobacteria bacterium 45_16_T64]|nr:LysR family transcriptional regulator [Gammaproteobacteria bacterium 45_16_T64]
MDTSALKAFVFVAEYQSFTIAAEKLFITQPAISKRISGLESTLHCQLFDRIGRQVILTEAGNALLPRANSILREIEETRRAMSNLSGEVSGSLSVGTSHHIGLHRLPIVLRQFTTQHPNVEMDLKFIDSEQAYELIMQGKLELGIVTLPLTDPAPLRAIQIWEDPLSIVVSEEHPLLNKAELNLQDLSSFTAILPSETTFTRRLVEALFDDQGLKVNVSISTNYLETIKMMVSIGLGWSVLPTAMIDQGVRQLNIEGFNVKRNLGVVHHPGHSLSNAARAMLTMLEEHGTFAKK